MKTNIWQKLPQPFFALAPMEDVTDTVFRQIIMSCGRPNIFFTEFMSVEGFTSKGRDQVAHRLQYNKKEKPLIAQIWGIKPEAFAIATKEISKMGFDGIDINMGCPQKKIVNTGGCAMLIKNPSLAKEIILAVKENTKDVPISVKTRIGYEKIIIEDWIGFLLEQDLSALTVHGRIAVEMSLKPANWDEIKRAVELRNQISPKTIIIGNGDITSYDDGISKAQKYGVDGLMVGRGIFKNPYFFNSQINFDNISVKIKLELLKRHVELFIKTWGKEKNFEILKKYFKIYINGFDGAQDLRNKLMLCKTAEEINLVIIKHFEENKEY